MNKKNSSEPLSPEGEPPTSAVSGIGTTINICEALIGVKDRNTIPYIKLNNAPFLAGRSGKRLFCFGWVVYKTQNAPYLLHKYLTWNVRLRINRAPYYYCHSIIKCLYCQSLMSLSASWSNLVICSELNNQCSYGLSQCGFSKPLVPVDIPMLNSGNSLVILS